MSESELENKVKTDPKDDTSDQNLDGEQENKANSKIKDQPRGDGGKFISKDVADRDSKINDLESRLEAFEREREEEKKKQNDIRAIEIKKELEGKNKAVYEKYKDTTDVNVLQVALDAVVIAQSPQRPPPHIKDEDVSTDDNKPLGYVGEYNPVTGKWE